MGEGGGGQIILQQNKHGPLQMFSLCGVHFNLIKNNPSKCKGYFYCMQLYDCSEPHPALGCFSVQAYLNLVTYSHHHHQKFIIEDNHLTIILLLYILYYIRI
jgi:hypothetical protein